jgi:hypothetical protein
MSDPHQHAPQLQNKPVVQRLAFADYDGLLCITTAPVTAYESEQMTSFRAWDMAKEIALHFRHKNQKLKHSSRQKTKNKLQKQDLELWRNTSHLHACEIFLGCKYDL